MPRTGEAAARDDELLRLRQENSELKKSNLDKSDMVKKLGVQLTRIRNDWQSQATPGELAPVAKARAAAQASKADRISELEVELSQREAREERLQQQVCRAPPAPARKKRDAASRACGRSHERGVERSSCAT